MFFKTIEFSGSLASSSTGYSVDASGLPVSFDAQCNPVNTSNFGVDIRPAEIAAKINVKPYFLDCDLSTDPMCTAGTPPIVQNNGGSSTSNRAEWLGKVCAVLFCALSPARLDSIQALFSIVACVYVYIYAHI